MPASLNNRGQGVRTSGATVLETVFQLGLEHQVCLGVEIAGRETAFQHVVVDARAEPVFDLVKAVLEPTQHYEAVERDGVILIRDRRVQGLTVLDYSISRFETRRAPLQSVSNLLVMSLIRQLHPEITGFAGKHYPGNMTDEVGPWVEVNRTVRELLNLMVTGSQGGVWLARGATIEKGMLPEQPYWGIVQYSIPVEDGLSRVRIHARQMAGK